MGGRGPEGERLEREHCTSQVAMLKTLCYVTRQVRGKERKKLVAGRAERSRQAAGGGGRGVGHLAQYVAQ